MVARAHAMRCVGQHVVFQTRDGVLHQGMLHSVTDGGIYVSPIRATPQNASMSDSTADRIDVLQNVPRSLNHVEEAYWPFLFFPFMALLFLLPWAMWW